MDISLLLSLISFAGPSIGATRTPLAQHIETKTVTWSGVEPIRIVSLSRLRNGQNWHSRDLEPDSLNNCVLQVDGVCPARSCESNSG